jgi:hypothetical protein
VKAIATCPSQACYEPSVVVDEDGRVLVMGYGAREVAVSEDGGATFVHRPGPSTVIPGWFQGDAILHADGAGHVFVAGLVFPFGVQISRSSDAGRTWDARTFFPSPGSDRPWVATGRDGSVYVAFKEGGSELVYGSSDTGVSFGLLPAVVQPPDRTVLIAGPPIVDAHGRLLEGLFTASTFGPLALQVAISDDGGSSFEYHDVFAPPDASAGAYFPVPSIDADGVLRMAWLKYPSAGEGEAFAVAVSSSVDGGSTWSAPVTWSDHETPVTSPWIAARGDDLDLAWYDVTEAGRTSSLRFARSRDGGPAERTTVASGIVGVPATPAPRNEANTDFAHFAHLPDGRAVVVWSDRAVWLSVESPA